MKFSVRQTNRFKKGLKRMMRRGKSREKILTVVRMLANGETLPSQYRDHALIGDRLGLRDCHIENDWILLYHYEGNILVLTLTDTGTHADLGL